MMLSPQAARMGTVHTTLRRIGLFGCHRSFGGSSSRLLGGSASIWKSAATNEPALRHRLSSIRFNSSRAAISAFSDDSEDSDHEEEDLLLQQQVDLGYASQGHAAAMEKRSSSASAAAPVDEPWMINLGRNNNQDNEWLMGPRDPQEWFTGVSPSQQCPGEFCLLLL